MKQENNRSKLQERIAADLAAKAKAQHKVEGDRPDGVDDSAYMKDKKITTSLGLVWVVITVVAVGVLVWLAVASM